MADVLVPGGGFLNDLVVTERPCGSPTPRSTGSTRIALNRRGRPAGEAPRRSCTLDRRVAGHDGTAAFGANGIRELSDGSLVINNSTAGGLWRVNPRTGVAREIVVSGGPRPVSGDGLVLRR